MQICELVEDIEELGDGKVDLYRGLTDELNIAQHQLLQAASEILPMVAHTFVSKYDLVAIFFRLFDLVDHESTLKS